MTCPAAAHRTGSSATAASASPPTNCRPSTVRISFDRCADRRGGVDCQLAHHGERFLPLGRQAPSGWLEGIVSAIAQIEFSVFAPFFRPFGLARAGLSGGRGRRFKSFNSTPTFWLSSRAEPGHQHRRILDAVARTASSLKRDRRFADSPGGKRIRTIGPVRRKAVVPRREHPVVSGKFCKSRCGGWSWYAGDIAITGSFGEDAHHDQEAG